MSATGRHLGGAWHWLKKQLTEIEPVVSAFGAVASALIAYFAYSIDIKVQENALKEGRISRAVAISQSVVNDNAIVNLLPKVSEIEVHIDEMSAEMEEDSVLAIKRIQIRESTKVVDEWNLRPDLTILLAHVKQLTNCMGLGSDDASTDFQLCDPNTVFALSGGTLTELYMSFRPFLYCDEMLKKDDHDHYRSFVQSYYEFESRRSGVAGPHIIVKYDENEISRWENSPESYRVIEFGPESLCDHYNDTEKS